VVRAQAREKPLRLAASLWTRHGEQAFRFKELDRLRDDFPEILRADELKTRQALRRSRLQATAL
jgi:hypothetical protein